jgi:hypothetical protein
MSISEYTSTSKVYQAYFQSVAIRNSNKHLTDKVLHLHLKYITMYSYILYTSIQFFINQTLVYKLCLSCITYYDF